MTNNNIIVLVVIIVGFGTVPNIAGTRKSCAVRTRFYECAARGFAGVEKT